ncbi:hypothetical protein [Persephonella sp.]
MNRVYFEKSIERLEIASWQINNNSTKTLGSTLYFALFNFMQAILSRPPEGRWKHIGINRRFAKYCVENNIMDRIKLRNLYDAYEKLYFYRIKGDYTDKVYSPAEIRELIVIFEFIREVIEQWEK